MFFPSIIEITKDFPEYIKKDMELLLSVLDYNPIWQTIEWQLMLLQTKYVKKTFFVGIYNGEKLLSYALIEKRDISFGEYGFFCIGGPIVNDEKSIKTLSEIIKELSLKEKVVFTQIEPLSHIIFPDFKIGYYKNFIEKNTAIIDLRQDDTIILARMKPKGRYNIRIAEKTEVKVEQVSFSKENLDIFYNLLTETLKRDEFAANSREYFQVFLQYLEKENIGGLFFAKRERKTIAAGIFVFYKKTALYYYGASSSDNTQRKYMASYLLQWKAIEEAKKQWCEIFDFLGIADPNDNNSPLLWVTDFKLKLTNDTKEWPKTHILILWKFTYSILQIKKELKRFLHRFN